MLHQRFEQSDGFAMLDYGQELVVRVLDLPFVHLFPYVNDHVAVEPVESIHSTAKKKQKQIEFIQVYILVNGKNEKEFNLYILHIICYTH